MSIRGLRGRIGTDTNETKDVTVTETGSKVAIDVNVVAGGAGGGSADSTAANQTTQITEAQSTNTKLDALIAIPTSTATSDTTEAKQDDIIAKLEEMRLLINDLRDEPVHDTTVVTYVVAGNGAGEVESIEYYSSAVLVLTRTFSYDSSNRFIGKVDS